MENGNNLAALARTIIYCKLQDKLAFWTNFGSLGTNHDEFLIAMNNYSVDIMAINETWLRPGEEGRAPVVPGYKMRHVPRSESVRGGRGGGVAFYIKTGLHARIRTHPEQRDVEQLWISLNLNGKTILIGTAYRPPWFDFEGFLNGITASTIALAPYDNIILLGDFNVNLLDGNSTNSKRFNEFLSYMNLKQIVQAPTHYTGHSCSLIDMICTDIISYKVEVDHINELNQHSFITCEQL